MGEYFMYVNLTKRQYVQPASLEYNMKRSGIYLQTIGSILAMLLVEPGEAEELGPLAGAWSGDRVVIAADEAGTNDSWGFATSTTENPDQNLYQTAEKEFENISYLALISLFSFREYCLEEWFENAKKRIADVKSPALFLISAYLCEQLGATFLEPGLVAAFGSDWKKRAADYREHIRSDTNWHSKQTWSNY